MLASRGPDDELASKAKFYAVGVYCDLVGIAEVAAWADARFCEQLSPTTCLMDIALATKGSRLELVGELDRIAERGGVKALLEADVRTLLERLAREIDGNKFSSRETVMVLDWIGDNMRFQENLAQEIREETTRFSVGLRRVGELKLAWSELRRWLEHAR
jgi:hypothetical protein